MNAEVDSRDEVMHVGDFQRRVGWLSSKIDKMRDERCQGLEEK